MDKHADTIRRLEQIAAREAPLAEHYLTPDEAAAILAERQQAIDALREAHDDLERILPPRGHEELAQGVYFAHRRIDAALVSLGEG